MEVVVLHAAPKTLVSVLAGAVQLSLSASVVTKTYSGSIVQHRTVQKGGTNALKILLGVAEA